MITWKRAGSVYAGTAQHTDGRSGYVVEPCVRRGQRIGWTARLGDRTHLGLWPTLREAKRACETEAYAHAGAISADGLSAYAQRVLDDAAPGWRNPRPPRAALPCQGAAQHDDATREPAR